MLTRKPNPEGKGEISLYQLMINALRQRPDIIIVGEVRTAKDAETLFEAIHTGHSVYSTLHADNIEDTVIRMTNPPINSPKIMMNSIGSIVSLIRHRTKNIRRVLEFGEMLKTGDAKVLYRWDYLNDAIIKVSDMTRLKEILKLYGGYDENGIESSLKERAKILDWMTRKNILNIDDAGFIVSQYYKNREKILDMVEKDEEFSKDKF